MKNFVQRGLTLTLTAPYARLAGQGMLVGFLFGICANDVASGADVECDLEGVFDVTAVTADTFAQGAKVYWDDTAKKCTSTPTSNTLVGAAALAKANGDTTVRLRLNPQV